MDSAYSYFEKDMKCIDDAIRSIEKSTFEKLVSDCNDVIKNPKVNDYIKNYSK